MLRWQEPITSMTTFATETDWLSVSKYQSKTTRYFHCLLKEESSQRPSYIEQELISYVRTAHEDALHWWCNATASLDPLEPDTPSISLGYPALLPLKALKGYFGEVFAALVAEHFEPFEEDSWKVPAHLFRWHNAAFEYLESLRQGGRELKSVVGRTGDDCLAFHMDDTGTITKVLYCEAKCTNKHDTEMIKDAHKKVGASALTSVGHLIAILDSRTDDESKRWTDALRRLYLKLQKPTFERYDLVSYVCGQHPIQTDVWIARDRPHADYKGGRPLQVVEVHLRNVDKLVKLVYGKPDDGSENTNN